jgi:hypothetical protein
LEVRDLNNEEKASVTEAISDLRSNGEANAADYLEAMLKMGKIKVDTESSDYATRVGDELHIGRGGLDLVSEKKNATACLESARKGRRIEFASHLLHEWVHLTQQGGISGKSNREIGAYLYQELYLKRYIEKLVSAKYKSNYNDRVALALRSALKELYYQRKSSINEK